MVSLDVRAWKYMLPNKEVCTVSIMLRFSIIPLDFQVRLTGGPTPNVGRVEVQYFGVWGSVVHVISLHSFGNVVCRQLGYTRAFKVFRNAVSLYGRGSGPVWMTHVRCVGNETSVGDCWHEKYFHNRIPETAVICHGYSKHTS